MFFYFHNQVTCWKMENCFWKNPSDVVYVMKCLTLRRNFRIIVLARRTSYFIEMCQFVIPMHLVFRIVYRYLYSTSYGISQTQALSVHFSSRKEVRLKAIETMQGEQIK